MSLASFFAGLSAGFGAFTSEVTYSRLSGGITTLPAFAHGLFGAELEAAAQQYTDIVTVRKADLDRAGLYPPQRFDRIAMNGRTFSVETWKNSPASGEPVFVRLFALGGQT